MTARDFRSLEFSRSTREVSGPASDLAEKLLMRLEKLGQVTAADLLADFSNASEAQRLLSAMINLKLVKQNGSNLELLSQGSEAIKRRLYSVSTG